MIDHEMAPGSVGRCQKGSEVREPNEVYPFDPKKSAGKKHEKPTVNMMENPISFCSEIIYKWPCSTAMLGSQRLSKSGHVAC